MRSRKKSLKQKVFEIQFLKKFVLWLFALGRFILLQFAVCVESFGWYGKCFGRYGEMIWALCWMFRAVLREVSGDMGVPTNYLVTLWLRVRESDCQRQWQLFFFSKQLFITICNVNWTFFQSPFTCLMKFLFYFSLRDKELLALKSHTKEELLEKFVLLREAYDELKGESFQHD